MIPRQAVTLAQEWGSIFRVLVIAGLRQSGKTTLARMAFPRHAYCSLEDPDRRLSASDDPRGFLAQFGTGDGVIIDEIQRCPDLVSYLQAVVDADQRPGRWVLTGSAHFHLIEAVTQSLAGRAGLFELMTCSYDELLQADLAPQSVDVALLRGGFPEPAFKALPIDPWCRAYLASVLERDLRQVIQVRDLDAFQRFVGLCAGRVGQLINRASLGADAGVSAETVDRWLSALQAAHLIFLLRPHHANFGKRLIKAPKLYFTDVALATHLLGIKNEAQLGLHPLRGNLFENLVIAELRRQWCHAGERPPLFFWRDSRGTEIDLIIERPTGLSAIEIKAGQTIAKDWFRTLHTWRSWAGTQAEHLAIVYGGDQPQPGISGVGVLPWHHVATLA